MLVLSFLIMGSIKAQQKLTKVSQSIKVNKDVKVNLNTSNCNVIFDTWNKNTVEIEAYIEGEDLNNESLQDVLKSWDIDIDGSTNEVSIKTTAHGENVWVYNTDDHGDTDAVTAVLNELHFELADVPDIVEGFEMAELAPLAPMPPMSPMPELPELPQGVHKIKFDYEAYKRDGDKYLEEYSKEFDTEFGEDFAEKMEAWGKKFIEQWSDNYERQIEAWAESFEDRYGSEEYAQKMEALGEKYAERAERQAARMEAHAERQVARMEAHAERMEHRAHAIKDRKTYIKERDLLLQERQNKIKKMVHGKSNSKVKKIIKIKIPKSAKLKIDVRHGEIEFATNIDNLKADLAYTKFKAYSINGSRTSINASYSPITVANWNTGELNLSYVKSVDLEHVNRLVLNAKSSNINIGDLVNSAIIDGDIGQLKIAHIENEFSNLNIILQNSDAVISLPKGAHNLQYKGTHSRFTHPKKTSKENTSNFTLGNTTSGKNIVINAKYSNVKLQ